MADQTEKQRAKKKQIITAAIHCFVQKGFMPLQQRKYAKPLA